MRTCLKMEITGGEDEWRDHTGQRSLMRRAFSTNWVNMDWHYQGTSSILPRTHRHTQGKNSKQNVRQHLTLFLRFVSRYDTASWLSQPQLASYSSCGSPSAYPQQGYPGPAGFSPCVRQDSNRYPPYWPPDSEYHHQPSTTTHEPAPLVLQW